MLSNVYPKLPKGVRGGFNCTRNLTWFFKHRRIWAYTGYRLMPGYPKRIDDPYYSVNTRVFSNINETIFLFKVLEIQNIYFFVSKQFVWFFLRAHIFTNSTKSFYILKTWNLHMPETYLKDSLIIPMHSSFIKMNICFLSINGWSV